MIGVGHQNAKLGCLRISIGGIITAEGGRSAVHQPAAAPAHPDFLRRHSVEEEVQVHTGKRLGETLRDVIGYVAALIVERDPRDLYSGIDRCAPFRQRKAIAAPQDDRMIGVGHQHAQLGCLRRSISRLVASEG